jgi:hypothetical protein
MTCCHLVSGKYKDHYIRLSKADESEEWHIKVVRIDGCLINDGVWLDSQDKTPEEAIDEAIKACNL